jgi:hypothetical protein
MPAENSNAPLRLTRRIECCELLLFQWAICCDGYPRCAAKLPDPFR